MGTLVFALFLHSQLVQLVILYIIAPTPSLLTRSRSFTPLHFLNSRYFSHKIPFAKMYKFLILAASAAFASAYTTPTTKCTDGCNPIAKPGLNEVVPAGPGLRTLSPLATAATASSSSTMRTVPTSGPPSLALPTTATVVLDLLLALPRHPRRLAPLLPAMALSAPALPRPSATQSASPIPPLRSRRSLPLRLTPRLPFPLRPAQLVFPQPRQSLLNPPTVPLLLVL